MLKTTTKRTNLGSTGAYRETTHVNGRLQTSADFRSNGVMERKRTYLGPGSLLVEEWYENGRMKSQSHTDGKKLASKLQGMQRSWFPDGQMQYQGSRHDNGSMHGRHLWWHNNGQQKLDESYHLGVLDGIGTHWDEKGTILSKSEYVNGNLHGVQMK